MDGRKEGRESGREGERKKLETAQVSNNRDLVFNKLCYSSHKVRLYETTEKSQNI